MFGYIGKTLFSPTVVERKFDALCFNLILFDVFFLPLFPWFSVSISLPIICVWYLKKHSNTKHLPGHKYFPIITILMVISTLFSIFNFQGSEYNTDFFTSFKRLIQYITSFWYFFFFLYFFVTYKRDVSNVVLCGIIYIFLYALLFTFSQDTFILLKQTVCPFDPQVGRWLQGNMLQVYRFNYLWADPNNVAYASISLSLFYFNEKHNSLIKKYIVLLCLVYILVCTMSMGGIAVAAVLMSYVFIFTKLFRKGRYAILISSIIILLIICGVIYYFDVLYQIIDMTINVRLNMYGEEGISGGGGRGRDFMNGINKFNPLFLIIGSGKEGYVSEIGHIYIWYMYGLPVYIYFIYMLYWKRFKQTIREYISIVPLFVAFTMNIAIVEQKVLLITLFISAYYFAKSYRSKCKVNSLF